MRLSQPHNSAAVIKSCAGSELSGKGSIKMGLFGVNYAKEGPGIDKNAPQKKRFFLFWDIYFRKFWKLIQLNLVYFLFYIPAGAGLYFMLMDGINLVSILLILISVVLLGPATAGVTYVVSFADGY